MEPDKLLLLQSYESKNNRQKQANPISMHKLTYTPKAKSQYSSGPVLPE